MKIMNGRAGNIIIEFPNKLLSEHNAYRIHNQTLARLNTRGGLEPTEAIANIFGLNDGWILANTKHADKHIALLEHISNVVFIE